MHFAHPLSLCPISCDLQYPSQIHRRLLILQPPPEPHPLTFPPLVTRDGPYAVALQATALNQRKQRGKHGFRHRHPQTGSARINMHMLWFSPLLSLSFSLCCFGSCFVHLSIGNGLMPSDFQINTLLLCDLALPGGFHRGEAFPVHVGQSVCVCVCECVWMLACVSATRTINSALDYINRVRSTEQQFLWSFEGENAIENLLL